jgi:hypothetical protein
MSIALTSRLLASSSFVIVQGRILDARYNPYHWNSWKRSRRALCVIRGNRGVWEVNLLLEIARMVENIAIES